MEIAIPNRRQPASRVFLVYPPVQTGGGGTGDKRWERIRCLDDAGLGDGKEKKRADVSAQKLEFLPTQLRPE